MANKNFEVKHGLSVGGTERITAAGAGSLTNLTLSGNLTVNGTTVTLDASTLQVADKNIVLNYHASNDTSSAANGAGITIQDAVDGSNNATILWDASNDEFDFSHNISSPGLLNGAANSFIYLAGGNASNGGSNILLYGQSHSSDASTTAFRAGGTETMRITSSGLVGIGATSPQAGLELASTAKGIFTSGNVYPFPTGNAYIKVKGTNAEHNWIGITGGYDQSSGSANLILQSNFRLVGEQAGNYIGSETQSSTSSDITFGKLVGGSSTSANATKSEFMRIDSNGNLLVGTTSTNGAVSGGRIFSNGRLVTTVSAQAHYFNRLSSDGDIVSFYKDSSAVGSIGAGSDELIIGTADTGLRFFDFGDAIIPRSTSNGTRDGTTDLGASTNSFKDLHLSGSVYADLIRNDDDTDTYIHWPGNNQLAFNTGGSERMRIDASGNAGIGLTPKTDWHTGYRAIQIGESSAFFANTAADEIFMVQNARYTSGGWKYNSSGTAALFDMQSGNTRWRRAVSGSDNGTVSWSDSMIILGTNGNVGIGTTSPSKPLHLKRTSGWATMRLEGASDSGGELEFYKGSTKAGGIFFNNSNALIIRCSNTQRMKIHDSGCIDLGADADRSLGTNITTTVTSGSAGSGFWMSTGNSSATSTKLTSYQNGSVGEFKINQGSGVNGGSILFSINDAEKMRINSNGRVLIGTTAAVYSGNEKMTISSTTQGLGIKTTSATQQCLGLYNSDAGGARHFIRFALGSAGSEVGSITSTGSVTAYNTSSDYRLKENIDYTWDATTRLKQLKPARFNFISDDTNTLVDGFLAHEVSSIVPEAITGEKDAMTTQVLYAEGDELPDGKSVGDVKEASKPDYQNIDHSKLVPLLVKTIQELEARIATLEG